MTHDDGVFYSIEDYASFWLRLMIELIDTFIVLFVSVVCLGLGFVSQLVEFGPEGEISLGVYWDVSSYLPHITFVILILIWFGYFVLLKHSKFGTVGYRIGHVRVVNLQGNNPSHYSLTLRLIFAVIGPLNILLDLLWIPSDPHRQSLRDKFAGTYVVKRNAQVAGRGKIIFRKYSIFGWNLLFQEVDRAANARNS